MSRAPVFTSGFTIVELMITLVVAAILAAIAAPSFTTIIQDNRLVTQINELQASLAYARSEAIKRNTTITVCPLSNANPRVCVADWNSGWNVFIDGDADGRLANADDLLRVHGPLSGGNTLRYSQLSMMYTNSGLGRANITSTLSLCDARGNTSARAIVINTTGRPTLAIDSNNDGIVDTGTVTTPNNNNVVCP